jgi:xylulose-5-phosphate/fructose-6-phosphate phosphoketolase
VPPAAYFKRAVRDKLIEHKQYVRKHGDDVPETAGSRRSQGQQGARVTSTNGT